MPHLHDQLEDALVGYPVVNEIGVFSEIDDTLTSENVEVLGDVCIGGFHLFANVSDGHLMFLQQAEQMVEEDMLDKVR